LIEYLAISGIEENLEIFDEIGRQIQKIIPPLATIWPPRKISVPQIDKTIGLLTIPKVTNQFRSYSNHVYIRLEKGNKLLSPQEIINLSYAKGFQKADREIVKVDFNLLKTKYYQAWKETRGISGPTIKKILEKTGLAKKDKGDIFPTRAAVLLFAEYPSDLMDTKCLVRVFQYTGSLERIRETPNLIGTPKNISGPLVKQIKNAHDYVLLLLRSGIKIPSGFVTQYKIPERAIKESITNAVIHRDYHRKQDIIIHIFEDRVEIESPGLFPYNITSSNIGYVRSEGYRNDLLVKHLREFPAPPNLDQNEGIRAMRSEMHSSNLYPPIFHTYPFLPHSVRVILLNEKKATEWKKVTTYLQQNKYITNQEARNVTGIVQRDKMSRILANWVKQGSLVKIVPTSGYVKATKYKLPETRVISQ